MKELRGARLFSQLPFFEELSCRGELSPKIRFYEDRAPGQNRCLLISAVIRQEESLAWKSFQEMTEYGLKQAALKLQGFFGFELLAFDLKEKAESFNIGHFAELVVNHARKLAVGEKKLIQYASLFGVLMKRVDETWGKMDFKTCVEVYSAEPSRLDLHVKKMLRGAASQASGAGEVLLGVHDLSRAALFRTPENEKDPAVEKILKGFSRPVSLYLLDSEGLRVFSPAPSAA